MTAIKIMGLPQQAMDVAISVAADVLHLWPSLDGYDAMAGQRDIVPDSQIMIQVPEYSKTNPFGAVDKDDKPSQETEERFRKTGWKIVEQTYWAVNLRLSRLSTNDIWKEMNITSIDRNAPWTRWYEKNVVEWEEVATMAMYPFKPGELMTGPVHYGKRYDNLQKALKDSPIPGGDLNLYHVVMSYPHPQKVESEFFQRGWENTFKEEGFVAVWPFGKNGRENNDMAFLHLKEGEIKMLFGENAYAEWIKQRDYIIGHYESINVQNIF